EVGYGLTNIDRPTASCEIRKAGNKAWIGYPK
ncbi:unnamed protein product, partial [marine sediment metagenome]